MANEQVESRINRAAKDIGIAHKVANALASGSGDELVK